MKPLKPLNPRRERFVQEYLIDLDPRAAAARAGYKAVVRTNQGFALLRVPEVAAAIAAGREARARRMGLEAELVIDELMAIAFSDIRNVVSWRDRAPERGDSGGGGRRGLEIWARDSTELSPAHAASIAAIRRTNGGGLHIRLHDKMPALALIGRHLGLFETRGGTSPQQAREARQTEMRQRLEQLSPQQRVALRKAIRETVERPAAEPE